MRNFYEFFVVVVLLIRLWFTVFFSFKMIICSDSSTDRSQAEIAGNLSSMSMNAKCNRCQPQSNGFLTDHWVRVHKFCSFNLFSHQFPNYAYTVLKTHQNHTTNITKFETNRCAEHMYTGNVHKILIVQPKKYSEETVITHAVIFQRWQKPMNSIQIKNLRELEGLMQTFGWRWKNQTRSHTWTANLQIKT